jgi:hypothetical protein
MSQLSPNGICAEVKTEVLRQDSNSVVSSVAMAATGADDSGIVHWRIRDCTSSMQ